MEGRGGGGGWGGGGVGGGSEEHGRQLRGAEGYCLQCLGLVVERGATVGEGPRA